MIWEATVTAADVEKLLKGAPRGTVLTLNANVSEDAAQLSLRRDDKPKALIATAETRVC